MPPRLLALALMLGLGLSVALLAAGAAAATAADFTWSGASPEANWSSGANWKGGTAPGGTAGTLTFPELSIPFEECTKLAATCYQSRNDLSALNVNALSFGPFGLAPIYSFAGNGLTLGSGGLSTSGNGDGRGTIDLGTPLALGASQTWSLSQAVLELEAAVTGTAAALSVQFGFVGKLTVDSHVEAGPITLGGHAYGGVVEIYNGDLNAQDGNPVHLEEAELSVPSLFSRRVSTAATGPLVTTGESSIVLAEPLAVSGAVKLDEAAGLSVGVAATERNGELTATGNVDLANAGLSLIDFSCNRALSSGEVRTLVTTTGSLTGTFDGLPDGSLVPISSGGDGCPTDPPVRIAYTAHAVTVTVADAERHVARLPRCDARPRQPGKRLASPLHRTGRRYVYRAAAGDGDAGAQRRRLVDVRAQAQGHVHV